MEENTRENKMGTMPIGKLLANMAGPVMISMLFQALYNIVDSVFVARLSQDAMNAVSLAFPLQTLCIAFAVGTGVGMNALLARSLGEKNMQAVDRAAGTGLFLTLCTAAVFAVLGFSLAISAPKRRRTCRRSLSRPSGQKTLGSRPGVSRSRPARRQKRGKPCKHWLFCFSAVRSLPSVSKGAPPAPRKGRRGRKAASTACRDAKLCKFDFLKIHLLKSIYVNLIF